MALLVKFLISKLNFFFYICIVFNFSIWYLFRNGYYLREDLRNADIDSNCFYFIKQLQTLSYIQSLYDFIICFESIYILMNNLWEFFKPNFSTWSAKNFNGDRNLRSLITYLCRVDRLCSTLTSFNVQNIHKKKTKFRHIVFFII